MPDLDRIDCELALRNGLVTAQRRPDLRSDRVGSIGGQIWVQNPEDETPRELDEGGCETVVRVYPRIRFAQRFDNGGAEEDRTPDLRIANVKTQLYKSILLAHIPIICHNIATLR